MQPIEDASLPPEPTEIVHRPEAGLARGAWEAPVWTFYVGAALVVLAAALYAAIRLGWIGRRDRKR